MTPELKARWVAALRSGQYAQGKGQLRRFDDTYCCLGVLANVQGCRWRPLPNVADAGDGDPYYFAPEENQGLIGTLLPQWAAGLTDPQQCHLASMNDGASDDAGGWTIPNTFAEIADWIEVHL